MSSRIPDDRSISETYIDDSSKKKRKRGDPIYDLFQMGREFALAGDIQAALTIFGDVVQQEPTHTRAICKIASILLEQNAVPQAEEQYRQAIVVNPHCFQAQSYFGQQEYVAGNFKEAAVRFAEAVKDKPDPEIYFKLSECYEKIGKFPEALKAINRVIVSDSSNPQLYFRRGMILRDLKMYREAVQDFAQTIAFDPDFPDAGKMFDRTREERIQSQELDDSE